LKRKQLPSTQLFPSCKISWNIASKLRVYYIPYKGYHSPKSPYYTPYYNYNENYL
jgi:hypothetical protein